MHAYMHAYIILYACIHATWIVTKSLHKALHTSPRELSRLSHLLGISPLHTHTCVHSHGPLRDHQAPNVARRLTDQFCTRATKSSQTHAPCVRARSLNTYSCMYARVHLNSTAASRSAAGPQQNTSTNHLLMCCYNLQMLI
jgi:hypothetical protein